MRTIQEAEGPEAVCVVFSSCTASWDQKPSSVSKEALGKELVAKCKIFVESLEHEVWLLGLLMIVGQVGLDERNYYCVLGTKQGSCIVTEVLDDGSVSWVQNPNNLEDRNSLAKLLFQAESKNEVTLNEIQQSREGPRICHSL